jgi:peptidoglycan-N-acetylglucosamine deacetylase
MWWAGVAWRGGDYEVAVVDGAGSLSVPPTRFGGRQVPALIAHLRDAAARSGDDVAAVIDSSTGMIDGHLLAAGFPVYRADPPLLPQPPSLGSVPAPDLARCGAADPAALHRLTVRSGALAGRVDEYLDNVARSEPVERELAAAGRFLSRGAGTVPEIALTFDDGPHPVFTPQVLELLHRYGVTATFFCVGLNVAAYPELVARIAEAGHVVGNHTWSHPYLPDLPQDELLRQVDATDAALRDAGTATRLVRPPYGARTPDALTWLAGHGYTTVLWDVDVGDWAVPGTDTVVAAATTATAGSIVLMHDAGGDRTQTVQALPVILGRLLDRGYRLVSIDELSREAK